MTGSDLFEERRLIDGARRGDEASFEKLYRRHRDYVLKIAARYGVTGDAALDVLQETFFYFFRKLPTFEHRARFTTFLYPVVKNLALKKKMNGVRLVPFEAVQTLSDEHREVALLRFVDDMSLQEIAEALAIPIGTVKSRLHHALDRLRDHRE